MQILYWHLTRPQTSTCDGSLSPPLLQRRDETSTSAGSIFPKSFIVEQSVSPRNNTLNTNHPTTPSIILAEHTGEANLSQRAMEIENDDQTPTFYLLNAVDLPDDEDAALNHHLELIHGQNDHENVYHGPLVAIGNGPSGDVGGGNGPPGGHYAEQPQIVLTNKSKKRRSNDLARVLCIEDESDDDSAVNIGPSKSKKAKLVVNLYPEDQGYSFGYQLPGSKECSESHSIPYSERYLLDSIDAQQIPHKMLCKLEDRQGVNLMRYRNQVIAEIRDYRKLIPTSISLSQNGASVNRCTPSSSAAGGNSSASSSGVLNGRLNGLGQESQKPVVKQIMLSPTTESFLCDFDMIVEKALQDREGWNAVLKQSSCDVSQLLADGSDSEFEYEVDLEASQKIQCNYLSYNQRLELEKNFVNQTAGPICLDPSPQVGLIANRMQYERCKWNTEEMEQATKRWQENPFKSNKIPLASTETTLQAPSLAEGRLDIEPFYSYVMSIKAKTNTGLQSATLDKDALRLPPISYQDYPNVEPPKNMEDILRIGQTPEPAQLRIFPNENSVRKIEEYILETERRKRPHTTTLSIFQRNGMESYFGELEMESFLDPNQPRIGIAPVPSSTKCQFELGSSRNVTLYVKQFSDIFTEDGRRPCKITYQKVGHAPQIVYTNSYKSAVSTAPATAAALISVTPAQSQTTVTSVTVSVPQVVATLASPPMVSSPTTVLPIVSSSISTSTNQILQSIPVMAASTTPPAGCGIVQPTSTVTVPGIITLSQQQRPPTPGSASTVAVVGSSPVTTTTAPSLPPVQIVHPQPRTNPLQQQLVQQQHQQQQQPQKVQTTGQRQIQIFSPQTQAQNITIPQSASPAANVNLNVNLSSSGLTGITPQQVLTRPHIVNVNLQQQQQAAAQQQLLQFTQQRLLRMKQQQPNTALAKLLLTNLQTKPITVAVQPTPQNPTNIAVANNNAICSGNQSPVSASCNSGPNTNNGPTSNVNPTVGNVSIASPVEQQNQQNSLGSPLMITSPPSVSSTITNPSPNVSVNVNASPNVSVNLNTISLDGLLAASTANVNYTNAATATLSQAGSNLVTATNVNLGLSRITTSASPAVNILRLNNNAGTAMATAPGGNTVQLTAVQRQLAVSNALNGNVSILQSAQQPQQRILINANSVNNLNLNSVGSSEIEELSVPDLTTLLAGQPIQISQLGQQQHILTNASNAGPSQTTIDTTNLNLNLNVNLNSGTVVNNGDAQVQQHQIAKIQGGEWTTTAQAPPFLVFISPLRPMSIATSAATTARQITATGSNPSTLSLNLGAVQASHQHQIQQAQLVQQTHSAKVSEGATRILLGTCNNGVAIKRELPVSSTASSVVNQGGGDNLNPNSTETNMDGHLLDAQQVVSSSDVVVDGVDSLFNALSEAIGPEQLQKLDAISGSLAAAAPVGSSNVTTTQNPTGVVETIPSGMKVVASSSTLNISAAGTSSASSGSTNSNKNNSTNVITLSDLLGSHTVVSSSTGNATSFPSLILSSVSSNSSGPLNSSSGNSTNVISNTVNSSPTLSSLLNSATVSAAGGLGGVSSSSVASTITQSSIVSSTPRLSALLAGTPSADTIVVGTNGPSSLLSPTGTADSSTGANSASYGSLLDRLAASLNQPQGTSCHVRSGTSRLNPIATATPSVVLDHPVLAATLTQQQQPSGSASSTGVNRGPNYRQIAPAPSPASNLNATTTASIGNNNVAVISSSDVQSHIQSPQLINLLGLVGNSTSATGTGQTRTIRISASSPANNPSPGSASR